MKWVKPEHIQSTHTQHTNLTLFFPMFPSDPPENIRKPKVFWCSKSVIKKTANIKDTMKVFNPKNKQKSV